MEHVPVHLNQWNQLNVKIFNNRATRYSLKHSYHMLSFAMLVSVLRWALARYRTHKWFLCVSIISDNSSSPCFIVTCTTPFLIDTLITAHLCTNKSGNFFILVVNTHRHNSTALFTHHNAVCPYFRTIYSHWVSSLIT